MLPDSPGRLRELLPARLDLLPLTKWRVRLLPAGGRVHRVRARSLLLARSALWRHVLSDGPDLQPGYGAVLRIDSHGAPVAGRLVGRENVR